MIVFRHELKAFLEANLEELFPTCTATACLVHRFIVSQHPQFNGTVTSRYIRQVLVSGLDVEFTDNPAWLAVFIRKVDLQGVLRQEQDIHNTITGGEALSILDDIPTTIQLPTQDIP